MQSRLTEGTYEEVRHHEEQLESEVGIVRGEEGQATVETISQHSLPTMPRKVPIFERDSRAPGGAHTMTCIC